MLKKHILFCILLQYDAKQYSPIRHKAGMNEDLSMTPRMYHSTQMQRIRAVKERSRKAYKTELILVLIVYIKASRKLSYDDGNFCDYQKLQILQIQLQYYKFCPLETEIVNSFCPNYKYNFLFSLFLITVDLTCKLKCFNRHLAKK